MVIDLVKYTKNLEEINCNACGENDTEAFSNKERFGLSLKSVICKRCGLAYINPRPTKKMYEKFNEADYRLAVSETDEGLDSLFNRQCNYTRQIIVPMVMANNGQYKPGSVLDIGCSNGGIAAGFVDSFPNIDAHGVEPVVKHAEYAARRVGMTMMTGLFEDYQNEHKFDVIVFAQALNHTLNPRQNLLKIRDLLSEQGVLFISLLDVVSALLNRPMERMCEMTHPYMFCQENIKYLLGRSGFEVVEMSSSMLDAQFLKRRDISKLVFSRMKIVARKSEVNYEEKEPDYREIMARMRRNMDFYNLWKDEILRWQRPVRWRQVYRYLAIGS